jgi:hypothetical protein
MFRLGLRSESFFFKHNCSIELKFGEFYPLSASSAAASVPSPPKAKEMEDIIAKMDSAPSASSEVTKTKATAEKEEDSEEKDELRRRRLARFQTTTTTTKK